MNHKTNNRIFGMNKTEFTILVTMGGLLLCVITLFGGYIIYDLNRPAPVAVIPPTSIPQVVIQPTNSPLPSQPNTPTPLPVFTPTPTDIPAPTAASPPIGTFNNPVPIGVGYTFPGFGTLTVLNSSWLSGQTGFAIVKLSFVCERPAGQECDLFRFMLSALGNSGNGYNQKYESAIPKPRFGSIANPPLYGGGTETGYVGFLIKGNESSLLMRGQIFSQDGDVYFKISN
jgi:hypothetical protein